ncbi:MAG: cell surface protein SprA [Candidatus Symbiothrix sp.]|jgi:cell surface protein SprA|nr:cell surface protein SprA [Candidatus Symbiothrix sp.]
MKRIRKYIFIALMVVAAGFGCAGMTYAQLPVQPGDVKISEALADSFIYNPQTNRYELRSTVAPDLTTPLSLTQQEYLDYTLQKSMNAFFKAKNDEAFLTKDSAAQKDMLSAFGGYNFNLGPAEKIFGAGGVQLKPHGSVNTKIGVTSTSMGNPTLTERQRNHTTFDFDPQIQLSANASIGEKMNFDLNYNTMSTFGFDSKRLKLAYAGKEDEIVKVLEAGNVSMTTSNSLIRGGQALFGIKTELQFGKLTVGAIVSQQESQSRTTASKGSVQTTPFEITVDNFDENQHFFFNRYFPDVYDGAMATLPLIQSGVSITRLEVWVTNRRNNYDEARNIVAFADLGENKYISNSLIVHPIGSDPLPANRANDLYNSVTTTYAGARNISQVTQVLEGFGMTGGVDYEKIENARKLSLSEYSYNRQLGYISLQMPLQPDEVLAVAYEYTYKNQVYQVGEFSTDNSNSPNESLYLKLVKGTALSPELPTWALMMRNIYTIANNRNIDREKFRLDIKYQSDTTGMYLNYITEGAIANQLLLRVENLDRLDARQEPHPDGYFDFVEDYTVQSRVGKIIFPSVQPFGNYLRKKIANDAIADKYVYQELYDSTLTVARQTAEKNKFILTGEYKGSGSANIELNGGNIPRGSVTVTANGTRLQENVDYTINYATGDITIINPLYENANIQTSFEDRAGLGMQRKTMLGVNLNYAFTPKFNIGATLMNLSEMPTEMKTAPGMESINNTLFGFNGNYSTQSQWLTNLVDKLPLLDLTAPSQITLSAEYAQLIAGHYKNKYGGDYSYVDDFEAARRTIDLRSPHPWFLASTPSLFPESRKVNDIEYGKNRALLAWYTIDGLFTRKSSLTPTHIKNDADQLSNHYVREIREEELYPNKSIRYDEASTIPVLNLAYYPQERGPYNLDAIGMNQDGTLANPKGRWGGIFRKIESSQTDFEKDNVETIEFWLLDPFIYDENASGGDLYFNLGDISEDILKDDKKFFENGLPTDGDPSKFEETTWGRVPKQQSLVYAFDTTGDRKQQDVGLDGLITDNEFLHPTYAGYLSELERVLNPATIAQMQQDQFSPFRDPAGDNYHYYRGSDYDREEATILERYKRYNGTEGNSVTSEDSPESYATAAKISPDVEDINQDNTLSENEKYFQYKVHLSPSDLREMKGFVTDKRIVKPTLKNGKSEEVTWYQFKIPVHEFESKVGGIGDFQSIRFVRMFMTGFDRPTILRFGTLELVRGDWRAYTKDLSNPNMPPQGNATISVSTVNIEENGDKTPVNYIMPPGVNRVTDPGQTQMVLLNEQSLAATIHELSPGDARAIYKTTHLDTRQYRRFQMFVHANRPEDLVRDLRDNELSIFLRFGSDYKNNYYEYEIPLKITPPAPPQGYNDNSNADREIVWPTTNMFDFPFELLTDLKLSRNKEKRQAGSSVTYTTPYSEYDPQKPMNKITVLGNPTLSEIKVVMIGVRNNSASNQSAELWMDEMRLTEFNEDGGWAANVNAYVALSDLGSVNFVGRKQTAGFGSLDQGVMERNLDDMQDFSVSTQIEIGKFFPEKVKLTAPVSYSYRKETISPKYNPLDQDVLLADALEAAGSQAEKDSINHFAVDITTNRSFAINGLRSGVTGKRPMPYDPANFTFSYGFSENFIRNASTEYDRQTNQQLLVGYTYVPMFKPWQPFSSSGKSNSKSSSSRSSTNNKKFLDEIQIGFLPKSLAFNSDISRQYYELQLRDLGSLGENMIPASFREDFYWRRTANIDWDLTKNLNFKLNTGTNARIDAPHVQVNKKLAMDDYALWKDSVWQSIRDFGSPMDYKQEFTANYVLPFKAIPALDFINGNLTYNAQYDWHRGAEIQQEEGQEKMELGNQISNETTFGLENFSLNLLSLYNKNKFLAAANKRYGAVARTTRSTSSTRRAAQQTQTKTAAQLLKEKQRKKYEGEVQLNDSVPTTVKHSLDNKRVRVTARRDDGRTFTVNFKAIDNNTIQITNTDSAKVKVTVSQLPPREDEPWYKLAQVAARGLMMVRQVSFSYNRTQGMMIPNFRPEVGDFFGQGSTPMGSAPGLDFAFGFMGESYLEKANNNDWLIKNEDFNITPAMFNQTETFRMTALVEPAVGLKINLNADRQKTDRSDIYYMYDGMPKRFSGNFSMTTVGLLGGSAEKAFEQFLSNRDIIAARLEQQYEGTSYPDAGFLHGSGYTGPYNPEIGAVDKNSSDVLIPSFLAAYTGGNANKIGLGFFPALKRLLPNWTITYDGLMQSPFMQTYFKSFTLNHTYKGSYAVGAYNSFTNWVDAGNGLGFSKNVTTDRPMPSSAYDITAVSILDAFDPLIGVNSTLMNNMTLKLSYTTSRTVNLNVSSYQIVETSGTDITAGLGYRIENFNKILHLPKKTGGEQFNNELRIAADVSFHKAQSLIRKIQDGFTQPVSGDQQTTIKCTADYNMSRLVTMQAYFDKQISKPLVSSTAYPLSKSSFGINVKISLGR